MPTPEDLQRLRGLLSQLNSIGNVQRGELIRAEDWNALVQSSNEPASDLHSASVVLSSRPPFYQINWANNSIEPRQPMSSKDWESVCAVVRELWLTAIESANLNGDDDL